MMDTVAEKEKETLALETRRDIYTVVKKHAGCHFREVQRLTGLSTGSVQYHLSYLVRKGLVKEQKEGKNVRYFPTSFGHLNKRLLGLLRQKSIRTILLFILTKKKCNHKEIVLYTGLSASTVSWHLKRLGQEGVIGFDKKGRHVTYYLVIDEKDIVKLLISYRESFVDRLVDNVVEMWDT